MWKQSAQNFHRHLFSRTAVNRRRALNDYKMKPLVGFGIRERGKVRMIDAPHIDDRQIHKTITQKVLIPMYLPRLIYDNGASLKNKGFHFSQQYFDNSLRRHIKKYGMNGWVILADFKGFFPNANREIIKAKHDELTDDILRSVLNTITDSGRGDKGLPLGVEPSQLEMISLPSPIDSYMNCQCGVKTGHYMDDYHILVPPDRDPNDVMRVFMEQTQKYDIMVSAAKTQIVPLGKPFKFCKTKRIFPDGKVIRTGGREGIKRARRKIKHFSRTEMKFEDIYTSVNSSLAHLECSKNHKRVLKLRRYFYSKFGFSCESINEFRKRERNNDIYNTQAIS